MTESLRALLTGVIDYAGLFPPATLPLDQAIRNYALYLGEPESWMLGKFICPAGNLAELSNHVQQLFSAQGLHLSVLLGGGKTSEEYLASLRRELKLTDDFLGRHQQASVDAFEVRLPADYGQWATPEQAEHFAKGQLALKLVGADCYWELPPSGAFRLRPGATDEAMVLQIGSVDYPLDSEDAPRRFKLRCGGVEAAAFPSAERVAGTLATSCSLAAAVKFTAGLHHPIRRFDAGLQVKMHGFINVFVAGVLAHARNLDEGQLRHIVAEEDPARFRFDQERLHWQDLSATVGEITAARRVVTSFGSCSFDEPRDDLRTLGWL